jgi:hypothetical protein
MIHLVIIFIVLCILFHVVGETFTFVKNLFTGGEIEWEQVKCSMIFVGLVWFVVYIFY